LNILERMTRFECRRGGACLHPDKLCFVGARDLNLGPDSYRDRGATSAYPFNQHTLIKRAMQI